MAKLSASDPLGMQLLPQRRAGALEFAFEITGPLGRLAGITSPGRDQNGPQA